MYLLDTISFYCRIFSGSGCRCSRMAEGGNSVTLGWLFSPPLPAAAPLFAGVPLCNPLGAHRRRRDAPCRITLRCQCASWQAEQAASRGLAAGAQAAVTAQHPAASQHAGGSTSEPPHHWGQPASQLGPTASGSAGPAINLLSLAKYQKIQLFSTHIKH